MAKDTHETSLGKAHTEKAPPPKKWEDPPEGQTVIAFKNGAPLLAQYRSRHMSPEGGFYSKSTTDGGFTILESAIDGWAPVPEVKWVMQNV